jgi:hypothetical protein
MAFKLPINVKDKTPLNTPVRFSPRIETEFLNLTRQKLSLARYPEEQEDFEEDDWSQGAKVKEVKRLAQFWLDNYDWQKTEVGQRSPSCTHHCGS